MGESLACVCACGLVIIICQETRYKIVEITNKKYIFSGFYFMQTYLEKYNLNNCSQRSDKFISFYQKVRGNELY